MNNNFEKYLGIANHDIQMANTSQELKSYVASILYENDKKVEEIARLNNIINELEKDSIAFKKLNAWIVNRHEPDLFHKMEILDKLKELKENK